MRVENTDLQELGEIDEESSQEGREEIAEQPAGAGLALSVVVRPADGCVSLNTNCQDQEDTQTQHDPGNQILTSSAQLNIHGLCHLHEDI